MRKLINVVITSSIMIVVVMILRKFFGSRVKSGAICVLWALSESEGLSLYQLAEVMKSYGAKTAYNLDGGGSSTLYFNGQVINKPTTGGNKISERAVSDIVYIGY